MKARESLWIKHRNRSLYYIYANTISESKMGLIMIPKYISINKEMRKGVKRNI